MPDAKSCVWPTALGMDDAGKRRVESQRPIVAQYADLRHSSRAAPHVARDVAQPGGFIRRRVTGLFVDFPNRAIQVLVMTLANFPELQRLPRRARLKIAEELWDSAAGDDLPVPATHRKLIRIRRAAYERGKVKTLTMAQLKKSIRRRQSA